MLFHRMYTIPDNVMADKIQNCMNVSVIALLKKVNYSLTSAVLIFLRWIKKNDYKKANVSLVCATQNITFLTYIITSIYLGSNIWYIFKQFITCTCIFNTSLNLETKLL